MILAGGLLRLYWDSGSGTPPPPPPPPPPPAPSELPLGVENTARPNVNIRWGNRLPEAPRPITPAPEPRPGEEHARPVPLRMVLRAVHAQPAGAAIHLRATSCAVSLAPARSNAQAMQVAVHAVPVPRAAVVPAVAVRDLRGVELAAQVDDAARRRLTQRERNRRAAELALRLLEDE